MTIYNDVVEAIGNTPLIKLKRASEATGCTILGKAEFMNPGQSVKDRAGKWMILEAEKRGDLKPGGLVLEATAGNTGIGLAVVASARGYRTLIVIPETQSQEKKDMLLLCGATFFSYLAIGVVTPLQLAFLISLHQTTAFGVVAITGFAANLVAIPVWARIAQRLGKQRSWALGMAVTLLAAPVFYVVLPLAGALPAILLSGLVAGVAPVILFMPYSALGDVIDYDEMRSGTNHAASFSALLLVVIRLTATVGGPAGFYMLAAFRYSMTGANTAAAVLGLHIAYFGLPALCTAIAIPCALAYPLDARRAAIVRNRLERRRGST